MLYKEIRNGSDLYKEIGNSFKKDACDILFDYLDGIGFNDEIDESDLGSQYSQYDKLNTYLNDYNLMKEVQEEYEETDEFKDFAKEYIKEQFWEAFKDDDDLDEYIEELCISKDEYEDTEEYSVLKELRDEYEDTEEFQKFAFDYANKNTQNIIGWDYEFFMVDDFA